MLYIKYYRESRLSELGIPNDRVAFIFCGDFNSQPDQGVVKFMTEKFIPSDYVDFNSSKYYLMFSWYSKEDSFCKSNLWLIGFPLLFIR